MIHKRTLFYVVLALILCSITWQTRQSFTSLPASLKNWRLAQSPRNSTLGFRKIVALSKGTPWRVDGLMAAAAETGLEITIPAQPFIPDDLVSSLETLGPEEATKPSHTSALAWQAHLDLLKHIIQSGYETTLILEDDADWAIEIKDQMKTLSEKVRELTKTNEAEERPYGSSWDILWVGHCGEWWNKADPPETITWKDATNGRRKDWRGIYESKWLIDLPEGERSIFWSRSPICTFAYAVSQAGAVKALEWTGTGQDEAYDLRLQKGCQYSALRCISVVDQLFHRYRPAEGSAQIRNISDTDNEAADGIEAKAEDNEDYDIMGSTAVILNSARCKALFNSTCLDLSKMEDRAFQPLTISDILTISSSHI